MARTTAPLFSMDASGTVAGAIVFSRWRGRNYVRRHAIPSNPRTGLQTGVRSVFRFLTQWWESFNDVEKGLWVDVGNVKRITGLNAFVAENVKRLREGRPFQYDPTDETVVSCDELGSFTASSLARAASLEWTFVAPAEAPWGAMLWMKAGTAPTLTIACLINVAPAAAKATVITGLTPGVEYFFSLHPFGYDNYNHATGIDTSVTPTA